jgi:RNA recognition motif-containing protein
VFFLYIYREPRGFGFVKYRYGEDAAEAKQQLNHTIIGGREIRIVFAEENRKTPQEMRTTSHGRYNSISATPFLSWNLPLIGINYLLDQSVLDSVFLFFSLDPRKKKVVDMEEAIEGELHQGLLDAETTVSLNLLLCF